MSKPKMVRVTDRAERDTLIDRQDELDCPTLWRNLKDASLWADADELRAWRATHQSASEAT